MIEEKILFDEKYHFVRPYFPVFFGFDFVSAEMIKGNVFKGALKLRERRLLGKSPKSRKLKRGIHRND